LQQSQAPEPFQVYLEAVAAANKDQQMLYPGSPWLASHLINPVDKLRLFELHPADAALLEQQFAAQKRQIAIQQKDGFVGIKACLPPPTKRGIVLIDPPYEVKDDYSRVVDCIKDSLKRFATGTYLIWYPRLQRSEPQQMIDRLRSLDTAYLHVTLDVQKPAADGFGMHGSGMWIINPPWTLRQSIEPHLNWLAKTLAQDATARAHCEGRQR